MSALAPRRVVRALASGALVAGAVALGACEACGACIGEAVVGRVVPHSDAGPEVAGCPLPAGKRDYVGTWRGAGAEGELVLAIADDCRVHYRRGGTEVNAPIMSFYGDDFAIGVFGLGTTFRVSSPPGTTGGVRTADGAHAPSWRMTVDDVVLTKTGEPPADVIDAASKGSGD